MTLRPHKLCGYAVIVAGIDIEVISFIEQKITVSIPSMEHGVLVTKTFAKTKYGCDCDFSTAGNGIYTVEVSTGRERIRKEVIVSTVTEVSRKVKVHQ